MSAQSMISQQRGPALVKGALVAQATLNSPATSVAFQYNPSSLRRTVTPQMMGGDPHDRSELVRFTGAPIETITLDVEIDAIDDLAAGDALAMSSGISSQLAALELFAFPPSSTVMQRRQQLAAGVIEIAPIPAPSLQFLWGPRRVLPVRLLGIQVTEEDFDQNLNPIRATVGISLRVLTYSDVAPDVHAYDDFLAYQRSLESLAARLASQRAAAHGSHT